MEATIYSSYSFEKLLLLFIFIYFVYLLLYYFINYVSYINGSPLV